jgi:hypothetical protein
MKTSTLITLTLSAAVNVASAVQFVDGPVGWPQALGFKSIPLEQAGLPKVRRAARAVAPKRQEIKTRNPHIPGSKTIKIRYGPYTVPGARV